MVADDIVLAAVGDEETDAGAVVATARRLGEATGRRWGIVRATSADTLLESLDRAEVVALVLGAGPSVGADQIGAPARAVAERARKPVVLVPPGTAAPSAIRSVLLPLEGTPGTSRPVLEVLCPLLPATVRLHVLHVFTPATVPRMLDRPVRDLEMLGRDFMARHCPSAHEVELHGGSVATKVVEIAATAGVDLVVLSWSQVSSGDRARVVRSVLAASPVPVLLLPAWGGRPGDGGQGTKGPLARTGDAPR